MYDLQKNVPYINIITTLIYSTIHFRRMPVDCSNHWVTQAYKISFSTGRMKLNFQMYIEKSAHFAGTFSSLASLSAPRAHDLIVGLRASFILDIALNARSYALCIHLSLFLIIWYWSWNQFYNITDDVNYTFFQSH